MIENWHLWVFILTLVFGAGGAYVVHRHNGRAIRLLFHKLDELNDRERRHHTKVLVILATLAAAGNPHPKDDVQRMIQDALRENGGS